MNETYPPAAERIQTKVVVTDIDMPFGSMVRFMVKWAFATIPAIFIIIGVTAGIMTILGLPFMR